MPNEIAVRDDYLPSERLRAALREHGWTWKSTGACAGLLGGVIAPVLGLALTALAWFIGDWHGYHLGRDGTVLLFLTIPLLIFGAHCMDLLDKEDERASGHLHLASETNRRPEEVDGHDRERD
ncbi:MAG TPA: hypothetical protein VLA93_17000 [Pyrinomonadaceae bacterium]|nr:hypothetical protein [Pyrinomonadaceae bacterium]